MNRINYIGIYVFPFEAVPPMARIILWGRGKVGTQFYRELISTQYAADIHWIDRYSFGEEQQELLKQPNTYVVIAILNKKDREEVEDRIIQAGMEKAHIINEQPHTAIMEPALIEKNQSMDFAILRDSVQREIQQFHELLRLKKPLNYGYVRVGAEHDGGYVMVDDFHGGIAYSFGINNDVSWDHDMARLGYHLYMYDHTIEQLPYGDEAFHFFKQGITGTDESDLLKRLSTFLVENHHDKMDNMILKMDVEGAEWDVFENISEDVLQKFRQIVVEFHGLCNFQRLARYNRILEKINHTHQAVHYHINNYGAVNWFADKPYGDAIEVTFVNETAYRFIDSREILPRKEDAPNCKYFGDISIGKWNEESYYG